MEEMHLMINKGYEGISKLHGILLVHRTLLMELQKRNAKKVLLWAKTRGIYKALGSQFRVNWKLLQILQDITQARRTIEVLVIKQ